jgi:hypothetical protein
MVTTPHQASSRSDRSGMGWPPIRRRTQTHIRPPGMDVWQGVAKSFTWACHTLPFCAVSGVAHPRGRQPAAVFYPYGHPKSRRRASVDDDAFSCCRFQPKPRSSSRRRRRRRPPRIRRRRRTSASVCARAAFRSG